MNKIHNKIIIIIIFCFNILNPKINAQKLFNDYKVVTENGQKILVDELNQRFILAEDIGGITSKTTALILNETLTKLPENVFDVKNLKVLILKGNMLTSLPDKFTKLPNLEVLDLSENDLYVLPKSLMSLKKLKKLDLSNNNELCTALIGFEKLNQIESLWLEHTLIGNIPTKGLNNLKLFEQNGMLQLDTILTHTPKLTTLYAQYGVFEVLYISLGRTYTYKFPEVIFSLNDLKKLSINCIMYDISIPKFCQLTKLESLTIHNLESFHENNLDMICTNEVPKDINTSNNADKVAIAMKNIKDSDALIENHPKVLKNAKFAFKKCLPICKIDFIETEIEVHTGGSAYYRNSENSVLKNAKNAYLEDNQSVENKVNLTTQYCATAMAQISINELEIAENLLAEAKKVDNTHFDILKVQLCLYIYKGKMEDAKALVSKWKNKPFDVDISFNKAFAEAIADANRLELAPDEVVKNLGIINKMLK